MGVVCEFLRICRNVAAPAQLLGALSCEAYSRLFAALCLGFLFSVFSSFQFCFCIIVLLVVLITYSWRDCCTQGLGRSAGVLHHAATQEARADIC